MVRKMNAVPLSELEAGLKVILGSPSDLGPLRLIVRRPKSNLREVLETARLELSAGLVGDAWSAGGHGSPADPEAELTLMNSRAIALIAGEKDHWPLAGDQLYVDLNLSTENLPPGTLLAVGSAIIAVTAEPHTGCAKFRSRFGPDAVKFVNSNEGRRLNLRGVNAKIIQPGEIRVGDAVTKC